jgi:hypothetical protein
MPDTAGHVWGGRTRGNCIISNGIFASADEWAVRIYRLAPTGIEDNSIPDEYVKFQNYPNPFNISTIIEYGLTEPMEVKIEIYDILGRKVDIIKDGNRQVGKHTVKWNAEGLPSGMYFYKIVGESNSMGKFLLLR